VHSREFSGVEWTSLDTSVLVTSLGIDEESKLVDVVEGMSAAASAEDLYFENTRS
jgi:hypothetical protein